MGSASSSTIDSDELLGEDSFASKYLNLDCEDSPSTDYELDAEASPPSTPSDTLLSPTASSVEDAWTPQEIERCLSPLDPTNFEFGIDADRVVMRKPWPYRGYAHQSASRLRFFDHKDRALERELRGIEEKLRARLAERFPPEEICGVEMAQTRRRIEKGSIREVGRGTLSPIASFSNVRGRAIYNP